MQNFWKSLKNTYNYDERFGYISMKKAFGMLEIVLAIIFVGMISEVILGISQSKQIATKSILNLNTHILLDSEIEQTKAKCKKVSTTNCSAQGGVSSGSNILAIGDTCTFTYTENGVDNLPYNVTSSCKMESTSLYNITGRVQGNSMDVSGTGFVYVQ